MRSDATISACGRYRYRLSREWDGGVGCVTWLMLNPSTADASVDDPTIRRCISFSKAWNRSRMEVRNLYALRSPTPADLWRVDDPTGPENDQHLIDHRGDVIVCAWGANAKPERVREVYGLLHGSAPLLCLGVTKDGAPRHPLYIRSDAVLQPWRLTQGERNDEG